jgi:hypothetical protein
MNLLIVEDNPKMRRMKGIFQKSWRPGGFAAN